jgi:hypothetical protein
MRRRLAAVLSVLAVSFASTLLAQERRESVPLNDWRVPFEQIRVKVMETEPLRIAERSLHPSVNAVPSAASHFITIVPCRIVDTRNPNGAYGGPKLVGGAARSFNVPGGPCTGIPASASAYSLNFTVLNGEGSSGFLTAYPTGSTRPTVSTLNFGVGNLVANAAIAPAGTSSSIDVYVNYNADLIIDINGYFAEGVVISLTAGTGLTGGGTGNVTLGLVAGGVTSTQLGANAVTTVAIQDSAITGAKIATGQVVKSINTSATDAVTISGINGASVTTTGSAIQVSAPLGVPSGSVILGAPGDTTLIGGGYREIGPSGVEVWDATATTGAPVGRNAHTAIWTGTKMIVWGGFNGVGNENSGAQYDPAANSWSATSIIGGTGSPSARQYHTAVWTGTKMIVWGGQSGPSTSPVYENTGAQYDPVGNSWAATSTTTTGIGPPSGRRNHTAVWTGSRMIVWGGASPAFENTGGEYDPAGNTWTKATSTTGAVPLPRSGHTAVWAATKMIVWGGSSGAYENTGGQYNPSTDSWTATTTTGAVPLGRENHTAVWTGTKMIVWGGFSPAYENTGGQYNPSADSWTATTTIGAPSGRNAHTAVWTGTKMIVWGGVTATINENTGAKYDPATNSWAATSTTGAPSARFSHTALWTGTRMIVWGGYSGVYENTGSQWYPLSYYIKN